MIKPKTYFKQAPPKIAKKDCGTTARAGERGRAAHQDPQERTESNLVEALGVIR
jgi:hypothetical protein